MDTTTVLEIIAILDTQINEYEESSTYLNDDYLLGRHNECTSFRAHLQSLIETQLNSTKLQTGE